MDKPKAYYRLLLPSFLLLSACTVDISQPDSSATAGAPCRRGKGFLIQSGVVGMKYR
ncbi:hypothetical protein CSR95_001888 [Escherichia coli]|nr:hypothetical protein [Escherichia coli]EHX5809380.1 hypothetical protein [Shigella dysenteriae]